MTRPTRSIPSPWHVHAVGVLGVAALSLLAYAGIVRPIAVAQLETTALRARIDEAQVEASRAESTVNRLEASLLEVRTALEQSRVHLESPDQLNRRLAAIVELATESGLVIHETRAGEVATGPRFATIPLVLSGSGGYPSCAAFLHRLYTELPDVEVLGFELSGSPGNPSLPSMFQFDLTWHAAPAVAAAP